MPRTDRFVGLEFDRLGVDQHGHVAVFISWGWGWGSLPVGVDLHLDEVDSAMDCIQELPAELQAVAHFAEFTGAFADAPEITLGSIEPPAR